MAFITDILNTIKNARKGKDMRQAIHDGIEQCYKDATGHPESVAATVKKIGEVSANLLKETADRKAEVNTERKRIDNLIKELPTTAGEYQQSKLVSHGYNNTAVKCTTTSGNYTNVPTFTTDQGGPLSSLHTKKSNYQIAVNKSGLYLFELRIHVNSLVANKRVELVPFINNTRNAALASSYNTVGNFTLTTVAALPIWLSANDTVDFRIAPIDAVEVSLQLADVLVYAIDWEDKFKIPDYTGYTAETRDIRTGADGTVYGTAGEAVRKQIGNLTEDLGGLTEVIHSKNLLDLSKLQNGFLQNNGTISVADWALDYWYTDKIPCTKSDIIFANGTSNPQNQLGGLYKNDKWVAPLSSNATISRIQDELKKEYYFKIILSEDCPDFDAIVLNTLHLDKFTQKFVMLNCNEPNVYSQYDTFSVSKMISKNVPAQSLTKELEDKIVEKVNPKIPNTINCWGNSLTFGYGATDRNTESYPKVLQKLLNDKYMVNNYAVSGEGAQQIASRQGGSLAYVQPCTIPANGSVNIVLKDLVGTSISLLNQGDAGINPCYINDIKGTLSKNGSNMVFTRSENGNDIEVTHPVPLITDANKNARDGIIIIWCGSNNKTYFNNSPTTEKNEIHNIIRCIKTMINHSNSGGKYIVIGMTSKAYMPQVETVNKALATEFGEHFLDVRSNILLAGLKESMTTPTEQDNIDIENGEIPSSLRIDDIHFNTKGYALIARYVYEHGKFLGYW